MKKYSHAWLAFMAVKRLKTIGPTLSTDKAKQDAADLSNWIMHHEDDIIQGAWYPDAIIKDMGNSHVLKFTPSTSGSTAFETLPSKHLVYKTLANSSLKQEGYVIDPHDNLPDRCEALTHSLVDSLKIQQSEEKGSPVAPTANHIALRFFMLSHYVADAHMPLHCDSRPFSNAPGIHAKMEEEWDDTIRRHYEIDTVQDRFLYDPFGFPKRNMAFDADYQSSYLKKVEDELTTRPLQKTYGTSKDDTRCFIEAICQYSYLLAYTFIPKQYGVGDVTAGNWRGLGTISFDDLSVAVLSDAADSIGHVWLRAWGRYADWRP